MNAWTAPSHATFTNPTNASPSRAVTQPRLCRAKLADPVVLEHPVTEALGVEPVDLVVGEFPRHS